MSSTVLLSGLALGEYTYKLDLTHPFVEFYDRVEDCLRFRLDGSMLNGISLSRWIKSGVMAAR